MAEDRGDKWARPCTHAGVKWSPEHGGCLMLLNCAGGDCCSVGEGEFPADENGSPPPHTERALATARQHIAESPKCQACPVITADDVEDDGPSIAAMVRDLDADLKTEGFDRIGRIDRVGRRSLWLKVEFDPGGEEGRIDTIDALVLRSGREGDDAEVRISRDNPQFRGIAAVLLRARDAADGAAPESFALSQIAKTDQGDPT